MVVVPDDIADLLEEHDAAFAAGDAIRFASTFDPDGEMLLVHSPTLRGREAIVAQFSRGFERDDTSAWLATTDRVELHGDSAYLVRSYTETLVPRAGGPRLAVVGRLVTFLRRGPDGAWRISMQMNNHSRPIEEMP